MESGTRYCRVRPRRTCVVEGDVRLQSQNVTSPIWCGIFVCTSTLIPSQWGKLLWNRWPQGLEQREGLNFYLSWNTTILMVFRFAPTVSCTFVLSSYPSYFFKQNLTVKSSVTPSCWWASALLLRKQSEWRVRLFQAKQVIKQFSLSHFEHGECLSNVYTDGMDPRSRYTRWTTSLSEDPDLFLSSDLHFFRSDV